MTYAAQFAGRQIAIGESITLNHSSDQVTINGQIFLRAGVLDTVAGYEASIATNPGLGAIVSNTGVYNATTTTTTSLRPIVVGVGTTTIIVNPNINVANSIVYRSTDLAGAINSDTLMYGNYQFYAIYDAIAVPAATPYIFMSGYYGNGGYYCIGILNSGASSLSVTSSTYNWGTLASKPDGSLVIGTQAAINSASNVIYKWTPGGGSTLPTTTVTGGSGSISQPLWLTWSIVASKFIAMSAGGDYGTSVDGIAWTKLGTTITGLPSNMDIGNDSLWGQSTISANSTTATVVIIRNYNSPFDWYVIRTADGTNFTATSFASLGLYPGAVIELTRAAKTISTRITVINNVFYIYRDNSSSNTVSPAVYSSTDGITWTAVLPILIYGTAAGSTNITFLGKISSSVNPFVLVNYSNTQSTNGSFSTLPGFSATHVGRTDSVSNQYIRVK